MRHLTGQRLVFHQKEFESPLDEVTVRKPGTKHQKYLAGLAFVKKRRIETTENDTTEKKHAYLGYGSNSTACVLLDLDNSK